MNIPLGSISGQFKNIYAQVFENGGQVDWWPKDFWHDQLEIKALVAN